MKSGATYYASAPAKPTDTSELDKHVVSAYFWVQRTHKIDEANMEEGHITTNGIKLPVLKNSVFLRPHTRLVRYVPEPQQVKGTSFVADAAPEPKDVPKAKRTKKATWPGMQGGKDLICGGARLCERKKNYIDVRMKHCRCHPSDT